MGQPISLDMLDVACRAFLSSVGRVAFAVLTDHADDILDEVAEPTTECRRGMREALRAALAMQERADPASEMNAAQLRDLGDRISGLGEELRAQLDVIRMEMTAPLAPAVQGPVRMGQIKLDQEQVYLLWLRGSGIPVLRIWRSGWLHIADERASNVRDIEWIMPCPWPAGHMAGPQTAQENGTGPVPAEAQIVTRLRPMSDLPKPNGLGYSEYFLLKSKSHGADQWQSARIIPGGKLVSTWDHSPLFPEQFLGWSLIPRYLPSPDPSENQADG